MAIVAKAGATFTPCPDGTHPAICCDVVDLGLIESNFGGNVKKQHKIRIVWQIAEKRDDGKFFTVSQRYTLSLHEKAALRKALEAWRGRPFTEDELQGFDVEAVIGVPCLLSVIHTAKGGTVYANINALMRLPRNMQHPAIDPAYVREQDRPKDGTASVGDAAEWVADDSDVPF